MLESLFGNGTVEKVLFYLLVYGEGYPLGIARAFNVPVNRIQQQMRRLENGGIVVSRFLGKVRLYTFNPRYPFLKELNSLLERAFEFVPDAEIQRCYRRERKKSPKGIDQEFVSQVNEFIARYEPVLKTLAKK